MINFFISILLVLASVFLTAVAVRYGLMAASTMDERLSQRSGRAFTGFWWYYRIPFALGVMPEYFYALVLRHDNYFSKNWWPLKTASFISVLVFIAAVKSRSIVRSYFSFEIIRQKGLMGLFTSGNTVLLLDLAVLLFAALLVVLAIESVRMHGYWAPLRIVVYGFLSLLMANLTVAILSVIIVVTLIYFVLRVLKFLFFSSRRRYRKADRSQGGGPLSALRDDFAGFKGELYRWEKDRKPSRATVRESKEKETTKPKRPKITRRRKRVHKPDDDIPRIRPDR